VTRPVNSETDTVLGAIVARHGASLLRELLELFDAVVGECLPGLRRAAADRDAARLAWFAHKLGGACRDLGGREAGGICDELQLLDRSGSTTGATGLIERLQAALDRLRASITALLATHGAPGGAR
jgi:HPt (histidine-containing phosphotransfer) domain-containing protein